MRHTALVICGGWVAFFVTYALTGLFLPASETLLPVGCGVVAAVLVTPVLHAKLHARAAGSKGGPH